MSNFNQVKLNLTYETLCRRSYLEKVKGFLSLAFLGLDTFQFFYFIHGQKLHFTHDLKVRNMFNTVEAA